MATVLIFQNANGSEVTFSACCCGHSCCPECGTVLMADGRRVPIEEVQVGEHVVTFGGRTRPVAEVRTV